MQRSTCCNKSLRRKARICKNVEKSTSYSQPQDGQLLISSFELAKDSSPDKLELYKEFLLADQQCICISDIEYP